MSGPCLFRLSAEAFMSFIWTDHVHGWCLRISLLLIDISHTFCSVLVCFCQTDLTVLDLSTGFPSHGFLCVFNKFLLLLVIVWQTKLPARLQTFWHTLRILAFDLI